MRSTAFLFATLPLLSAGPQEPADKEGLEFFEAKIRPVLADKCYTCHSARAEKVKGGLLLDTREGLLKGGDQGPALVPGHPEKSLLVKGIRWDDEDFKMPPKNRLPKAVVADIEAWIKRGAPDPRGGGAAKTVKPAGIDIAKGRQHWSLQPLKAVTPPQTKNSAWTATPVDRFILRKLEEKGIAPNLPADRRRLIRRASFDLTGLPPAPEEVDAFVADPDPDAYGKLVDRLLASPHYGERWARFWLDNARFAESHGFEQDYDREGAWPYRDFVIRALNDDMPYDRFVQWQVAGDELAPDEPLAWMATGFLGAGTFPTQLTEVEFEPARYEELDNMASTVGSAILGLSVGCARCHDHKYDPIPAKDYYRLLSTFTTAIRSHVEFDLDPEATKRAAAHWEKARPALAATLAAFEKEELPARFRAWADSKPWEKPAAPWTILEPVEMKSTGGTTFTPLPDGSLLAGGANPKNDAWTFTAKTALKGITAVRVEALADPSLKKGGPGRADNGNFALTSLKVSADGAPLKLASPRATFQQNATNLSAASIVDEQKQTGWAVDPQFGKDQAVVFAVDPTAGAKLVFEFEFALNDKHSIGRPRLSVATSADPPLKGETQTQAFAELLSKLQAGAAPRDDMIPSWRASDPGWQKVRKALDDHDAKKPKPKLTKILVTTEGMKPLKHHADDRGFPHFYKETHVLLRGDVNKKQEVATPAFLRVLMDAPEQEKRWVADAPAGSRTPRRRAALARWLTDTEAGAGRIVARVIANRLWHHHFGRGIVSTPNDFGLQGDPPSHPELLEWMAGELIRGGWRLKPLHRLLVTSAVYMESSDADPVKARLDPDNRLFWRRPLRRLEGEAIRDSMLAVSGVLDRTMYGPGTLDEGMSRRSIYFFQKRSKLISTMMLFDAPEALVSIGARPSTTIAPQALHFMNSPHVRKYAAALAKRLPAEGAVDAAYRAALGRNPTDREREAAQAFLRGQAESYKGEGKADASRADLCQILFSMSEFVYVD